MRQASRSSGLLRVEASLVRVSQSGLKTGGGATAGGARGTIVEVASKSSSRRMGQYDELRRTLLSCFSIFILFGPRGIVVI
jgi:hypothetical protein